MDNDLGSGFVLVLLLAFAIAIWLVIAWLAASLAPADRRVTFFWLTFLLGPFGVLLAIVASPRDPAYFAPRPRPIAPGRKRFACPRCGADNDIPRNDTQYSCWRCGEQRRVAAAKATRTVKPASRPKQIEQILQDHP